MRCLGLVLHLFDFFQPVHAGLEHLRVGFHKFGHVVVPDDGGELAGARFRPDQTLVLGGLRQRGVALAGLGPVVAVVWKEMGRREGE